jgi:hypothetical protein
MRGNRSGRPGRNRLRRHRVCADGDSQGRGGYSCADCATESPAPSASAAAHDLPRQRDRDQSCHTGSNVTVRGKPAWPRDGVFRVRLSIRTGLNRLTVVARHPEQRTARKTIRLRRTEPPAPPAPAPPPVATAAPAPVLPDSNGPDDPCPYGTNYVPSAGCVNGDY